MLACEMSTGKIVGWWVDGWVWVSWEHETTRSQPDPLTSSSSPAPPSSHCPTLLPLTHLSTCPPSLLPDPLSLPLLAPSPHWAPSSHCPSHMSVASSYCLLLPPYCLHLLSTDPHHTCPHPHPPLTDILLPLCSPTACIFHPLTPTHTDPFHRQPLEPYSCCGGGGSGRKEKAVGGWGSGRRVEAVGK